MANKGGRYSGSLAGPSFDAAMPESGRKPSDPDAMGYRGRDGNLWKRTK
jgi:hypothetical protein